MATNSVKYHEIISTLGMDTEKIKLHRKIDKDEENLFICSIVSWDMNARQRWKWQRSGEKSVLKLTPHTIAGNVIF